jgi:hypothetical protein
VLPAGKCGDVKAAPRRPRARSLCRSVYPRQPSHRLKVKTGDAEGRSQRARQEEQFAKQG